MVDWLDEYMPGSYRQAQVSFHAKLPNSIPVGDAMSLSNLVFLYTEPIRLNTSVNTMTNNQFFNTSHSNDDFSKQSSKNSSELKTKSADSKIEDSLIFLPSIVNMVSKHSNGTLNLWKLQFQDNSKYQSLINVSHMSRVCGHRFRVKDITSHPILPFLLTNSMNEIDHQTMECNVEKELFSCNSTASNFSQLSGDHDLQEKRFQKGLIIWGVESIGPLSKSGGIYELARIDSSKANAFENIAWFPCFLPSSTLGNLSSSPSTLFATTDYNCITIYQAVFDARTLLHDLQNVDSHNNFDDNKKLHTSNSTISNTTDIPFDSFNVVSIQSTARPGCIIELEKLVDSNGLWTKADLFHIYQEGLICQNLEPNSTSKKFNQQFYENYFLVLLEKKKLSSSSSPNSIEKVHMWKITISSAPLIPEENQPSFYNTEFVSEGEGNANKPLTSNLKASFSFEKASLTQKNRLSITSTRVCSQDLMLPDSVHVVCADSAAADLASSAMFTLSKVPYLFSTACSDGIIRFWSSKKVENVSEERFEFFEWKLNSTISPSPSSSSSILYSDIESLNNKSQIKIENYPLAISCSYNSRFAVAYKKKQSPTTTPQALESHFEAENLGDSLQKEKQTFANFCVDIYECESTGGSEWKLEDCISLKNIILPELDSGINFDYIFGNHKPIRPARSCHSFKSIVFSSNNNSNNNATNNSSQMGQNIGASISTPSTLPNVNEASKIPEIPSTAAIISIKRKYAFEKSISRSNDSTDLVFKSYMCTNNNLVKLDWASTENGSHILTVGLGNQIFIYSCVTKELDTLNNTKSLTSLYSTSAKKNDTEAIVKSNKNSLVKWTQFRSFELDSADDMQALPSEIKWVREGLLIVGLNTEMQIFSQWSSLNQAVDFNDKNNDDLAKNFEFKSLMKVPKNHSVLDLNKLSKLTKETSKFNKTRKKEEDSESFEFEMNNSKRSSLKKGNEDSISNKKTRVFDENQMLEIIQDSGLFMQTK